MYSSQEQGSKQTSGGCPLYKDWYVYDAADCDTYTTVYNNATNSATYNSGQKTCIVVGSVDSTFQTLRYVSYCAGVCAADCAAMKILFSMVLAHDSSRREAYNQYRLAVTDVQTSMQNFNAQMIQKVTPLSSISTTVATFITSVITIID